VFCISSSLHVLKKGYDFPNEALEIFTFSKASLKFQAFLRFEIRFFGVGL
jgi:hypothetical protein